MISLDDHDEMVGFFSYSRGDDINSRGKLSQLREFIQLELRMMLGRSERRLQLYQDKDAIAYGKDWERDIQTSISGAVFFIPIITRQAIRSGHCLFEFNAFLRRECELGRDDLIFPIIWAKVHELEDPGKRDIDPILSVIHKRQYLDLSSYRFEDMNSPTVGKLIGEFCADIAAAMFRKINPATTIIIDRDEVRATIKNLDTPRDVGAWRQPEKMDSAASASQHPRTVDTNPISDQSSPPSVNIQTKEPDGFDLEEVVARILSGGAVPVEWVRFIIRLDLAYSDFRNTELLGGLLALEVLNIQSTQVNDLGAISKLKNLISLDARNTKIRDVAPIVYLPILRHLTIGDTLVREIGPFEKLLSLQSLDLSGTGVSDLTSLKGLRNLESLNLAGTPVDNITPLAGLTSLRRLNLQATKVGDLSPLAEHVSLRILYIDGVQGGDVGVLRPLIQNGLKIIRE